MNNQKAVPQPGSMEAVLKDAQRWAALRDNGWTLYEVQTEIRIANTTGQGPTYRKGFKHAGWTMSCMSDEEFDTQDEAIDEAIRRFCPQTASVGAPAEVIAPAAIFPEFPLHEDRIKEVADEFQAELLHCGLESYTLERMIRHAVSVSEDAAKQYAQEHGGYPLDSQPLGKDAVTTLARHYQGELLGNGVELYYLKQMIRDALALAYPRIAAKIAAG